MTQARALMMGGVFNPLFINGCVAWFDATDASSITLSTTKVTQWNDKSANGFNVTQGTDGNRPTYVDTVNGLAVVTFTAGTQRLENSSATLLRGVSGFTLFWVYKNTKTGSTGCCFSVGSTAIPTDASRLWCGNNTSNFARIYGRRLNSDSPIIVASSGSSLNTLKVFSAVATYGSAATLYENGTQVATNATWLTSGSTPSDFGVTTIGGGNYDWLTGNVGEIVLYGSALSSTDRERIEMYLRNKWGTG